MCERLQGKTDAYSAIWNYLIVPKLTKCILEHILKGGYYSLLMEGKYFPNIND